MNLRKFSYLSSSATFSEAIAPQGVPLLADQVGRNAVKEAVFPFIKFPGVEIALGPEMKSIGEVTGIDAGLGIAYAKAPDGRPGPAPPSAATCGNRIRSAD